MERHEIERLRAHAIVCLNTVHVAVADRRGDMRFLYLSGPSVLDTLREIVALAPVEALYVCAPCAHEWTWRPEPVARKRAAARRSACSICGDRIAAGAEAAHYARHERAAAGDEDARGGAPRP